jgi:dipeptidyl aminopeptidase/acylaminoacyl peptidase
LYLRGSTLVAQAFDWRSRRLFGDPIPIGENVGSSSFGQGNFSISTNGAVAYWAGVPGGNDVRLVWRDRHGQDIGAVGTASFYRTFDLSFDDKWAIAHTHDPRSAAGNLWLIDIERNLISRFTATPTHDVTPLWSPDAKRVLFKSTAEDSVAFYIKSRAATGGAGRVSSAPPSASLRSWSRDGRFVIYDIGAGGSATQPRPKGDIFAFALDAPDKPIAIADSPFDETRGTFSPDGHWVAYQSDESGRPEIYVQSFPSRDVRIRVSRDGGTEPQWANSGKELFFAGAGSLMTAPVSFDPSPKVGTPERLFSAISAIMSAGIDSTNHYRVSADDKRFLMFSRAQESVETSTVTVTLNWPELVK